MRVKSLRAFCARNNFLQYFHKKQPERGGGRVSLVLSLPSNNPSPLFYVLEVLVRLEHLNLYRRYKISLHDFSGNNFEPNKSTMTKNSQSTRNRQQNSRTGLET